MEEETHENERERQVDVRIYIREYQFDYWSDHSFELGFDILAMENANALLNDSFFCANHYCD